MEYEVKRFANPLVIGEVVSKRVVLNYLSTDIKDHKAGELLKLADGTTDGAVAFWGGSADTSYPCAVLSYDLKADDFDSESNSLIVTVFYDCKVDYDRIIEANPDAVPEGSEDIWGQICAESLKNGLNIYKLNK